MKIAQELIIKIFPLEKVRKDFKEWLEFFEIKYNQPFPINGKYTNTSKTITLNEHEQLNVLGVTMNIDFYSGTYFYVKVAVGRLKIDSQNNNPIIDKCIIILHYNNDSELSLYDVDFYHVDYD